MVTWQVLPNGHETEVTFDLADEAACRDLETKGYGVASLEETERRRHLSLPETYYALAIDGVLPFDEPLRELWRRFESSSATFARNFAVYQHFRRLGWTPKPGLNYGAQFVLYRGLATEFHSEYVVYVQDDDEAQSWNTIQSLTRIAADVKKTVLLCTVSTATSTADMATPDAELTFGVYNFHGVEYMLVAIAIRFWDASMSDQPQSYRFQPQPILPKTAKTAKKKNRTKRPKYQLEGEALTGSGNST